MSSGPNAAGDSAGLPCLRIERTPANDVYLLLTGLGLDGEAEQALADPVAYALAHRAEAATVVNLLQHRLAEAMASRPERGPTTGGEAPSPARPAPRAPQRDEAGRPLRPGASLLR